MKTSAAQAGEEEEWKLIPGYEGLYAASRDGRIKSLRNGRVMSPGSGEDGYPIVSLYRAGKRTGYGVHRLIALTFHADKKNVLHCEVAHLDGSRANSRADNLKWVSKVENMSHKRLHGTYQGGEGHPRAKLSADDVRAIRASREAQQTLADRFGVSAYTISDITCGRRWKSLAESNFPEGNAP